MDELDLLDRKILYGLDLDSRAPISKLAKAVKASKETVGFRLRRLVRNGFIKGFLTTMLTSSLNRYYYKVFYKFHKTTGKTEKEIIDFIRKSRKIAWFGSFEGPYDLAFLILARSPNDLDEFLARFRSIFGEYILEQEIHTVTSVHRFNLKFFYEGEKTLDTSYPKVLKETKIDKIDYEIIKNLANDSRIPTVKLARKLGVDSGTVLYRLRKLRENRVLGTHTIAVNFEKFGVQHFQINFKLKNNESVEKIIRHFSSQRNATFATAALGKYDLAVELAVKDNRELTAVLDDLKEKYTDEILDHDTFLITKEHQVTWFPYETEF